MKKFGYKLFLIALVVFVIYGAGRLYFSVTGGFAISKITSDHPYQPQWEIRPLVKVEKDELAVALSQPYYYFGKGCQSYVFASEDGQYVIKFFKQQKFRFLPWLEYFPPLPAIVKYREEKSEQKKNRLNDLVKSWKLAFEHLKDETGLVYVHMNKSNDLQTTLILYDKIGMRDELELDQMEFSIQRKAVLLCNALLFHKEKGELAQAKNLIDQLLGMIMSEYRRGLADNDHALMQNTGVVQGRPVHIDVGQFVVNDAIKQPNVFKQELFTKTYRFKHWLKEQYPELSPYLEDRLFEIIGPTYFEMQPKWRKKW